MCICFDRIVWRARAVLGVAAGSRDGLAAVWLWRWWMSRPAVLSRCPDNRLYCMFPTSTFHCTYATLYSVLRISTNKRWIVCVSGRRCKEERNGNECCFFPIFLVVLFFVTLTTISWLRSRRACCQILRIQLFLESFIFSKGLMIGKRYQNKAKTLNKPYKYPKHQEKICKHFRKFKNKYFS